MTNMKNSSSAMDSKNSKINDLAKAVNHLIVFYKPPAEAGGN
ncbi:hypothetical protein J2X69_002139 [Algoriphagus sp. 4150]|nr:hypothetical protein [Algoriphagus sp. 4150]